MKKRILTAEYRYFTFSFTYFGKAFAGLVERSTFPTV